MSHQDQPGFSLIELMVVVSLIGILMLMSVPSYQKFVIENRRELAKQYLVSCGIKLAKLKTKKGSLVEVTAALDQVCETQIPRNEEVTHYQIEIEGENVDRSYLLVAQALTVSAKSDGSLTYDHHGNGCRLESESACIAW